MVDFWPEVLRHLTNEYACSRLKEQFIFGPCFLFAITLNDRVEYIHRRGDDTT